MLEQIVIAEASINQTKPDHMIKYINVNLGIANLLHLREKIKSQHQENIIIE